MKRFLIWLGFIREEPKKADGRIYFGPEPIFRAGQTLRADGHTMTFLKDMYIGDPLSVESVLEVDGRPPEVGQKIPSPITEKFTALSS